MQAFQGAPRDPRYVVVYEAGIDAPVSVITPDPRWLAMAMAGGILPPVEAYASGDRAAIDAAPPIGPMSEEEALEYLAQKDLPPAVWQNPQGNRRRVVITLKSKLPVSRTFRDAWALVQDSSQ
jgi:hypothetical protein